MLKFPHKFSLSAAAVCTAASVFNGNAMLAAIFGFSLGGLVGALIDWITEEHPTP